MCNKGLGDVWDQEVGREGGRERGQGEEEDLVVDWNTDLGKAM